MFQARLRETQVQLFSTSENWKKCAEVPRVPDISVLRKKAKVSLYVHPATDLSKSKQFNPSGKII